MELEEHGLDIIPLDVLTHHIFPNTDIATLYSLTFVCKLYRRAVDLPKIFRRRLCQCIGERMYVNILRWLRTFIKFPRWEKEVLSFASLLRGDDTIDMMIKDRMYRELDLPTRFNGMSSKAKYDLLKTAVWNAQVLDAGLVKVEGRNFISDSIRKKDYATAVKAIEREFPLRYDTLLRECQRENANDTWNIEGYIWALMHLLRFQDMENITAILFCRWCPNLTVRTIEHIKRDCLVVKYLGQEYVSILLPRGEGRISLLR